MISFQGNVSWSYWCSDEREKSNHEENNNDNELNNTNNNNSTSNNNNKPTNNSNYFNGTFFFERVSEEATYKRMVWKDNFSDLVAVNSIIAEEWRDNVDEHMTGREMGRVIRRYYELENDIIKRVHFQYRKNTTGQKAT